MTAPLHAPLLAPRPVHPWWRRALAGGSRDRAIQLALLLLGIALLVGGLLLPLLAMLQKSLQDMDGNWVGLANFRDYFFSPNLSRTIGNTLWLGLLITTLVVCIAFGYAYALTRTCMPGKSLFRLIGLIPLLMPSLLPAISLVYWFGNQGVAKGLLGGESIYGPIGIVIGLGFWCFPHALMILVTALGHSDARLYEAARVLGSPAWRTFLTVTLPTARYGLLSAAIAVFTLTICDFGVAKVIGGQYSVLATDIYRQVIGMQNFSLGAVASVTLLLPALLSFALEHRVRSKMQEQSNSKAVPYSPTPHRLRDLLALLWCGLWALLFLALVGMAIYGSLVQFWPYNLTLTLEHYAFDSNSVYGWQPFINTLKLGALTAITGTLLIVVLAWAQEKGRHFAPLRQLMHLLAMLSLAVPGMVLGLGYIFFFNRADSLLGGLYGTLPLMVLSCIIHYYTVGHMTALTSLKQLPKELELVAISLRIPLLKAFWRVTLPASLPALLEIFIYLFVNAMTTTSAVIFLYSSDSVLASIAVLNMEDSGDTAAAAAMATLILLAAAGIKLLQLYLSRTLLERTQRWRHP
ncbi:putative 2-aminoethylphosphonate ABC transporter permease subunit [Aeromonas sp. sia0103]|uniref:putative 2-aminoethylphosphonate ABC transporter permease subunit n=1 Tax=Aeromonas sp. sia0103 TaxID=2854782 RepID=UPI001C472FBE|nr:putative 2-aminoethylphosphonate ABC transporter permease subunit [Aeromonas sp. sia0103]MBV7597487.1 putative 2-aminoethylphosphonate ABC transporter permease subunit [Aeromonas sp. sia0103]